jgi:hypothetical protein
MSEFTCLSGGEWYGSGSCERLFEAAEHWGSAWSATVS